MRKRFLPRKHENTEFELDLAPLLAVMVKLVPVLLVSTAFVQVMVIETELPQAVKQAVEKPNTDTSVALYIDSNKGIEVRVREDKNETRELVPLTAEKEFDFETLHKKLVSVKQKHNDVFRLDLNPNSNVNYKTIVRVMDEARRSRDRSIQFSVKDAETNNVTQTDFMFPDVTFANAFGG